MADSSNNDKLYSQSYLAKIFILGLLCGIFVCLVTSSVVGLFVEKKSPAEPAAQNSVSAGRPSAEQNPKVHPDMAKRFAQLARRNPDDQLALGKVDAPVVLIEYADYRCPFCSLFATSRLPHIIEDYVDKGLVRFEFRDMPIFGDDSFNAAVAGRAAARQGKFLEFQHLIAQNGVEQGGHPALPRESLIDFAQRAGVEDIETFTKDLDDPHLAELVRADYSEAQSLGLGSVPGFIVGSTPVQGAQEYETFRQVIDKELDAAKVHR